MLALKLLYVVVLYLRVTTGKSQDQQKNRGKDNTGFLFHNLIGKLLPSFGLSKSFSGQKGIILVSLLRCCELLLFVGIFRGKKKNWGRCLVIWVDRGTTTTCRPDSPKGHELSFSYFLPSLSFLLLPQN